MDKCTREVRKQYWKNFISQCLQRPEGMIAKLFEVIGHAR